MEYNFDGKPHALSKDLAYIISKYEENISREEIKEVINKIYREYAEYLYKFNKEKVIDYVISKFDDFTKFSSDLPDTSFIHRTPIQEGPLSQYGTIALKFKRYGDGLDDQEEKDSR